MSRRRFDDAERALRRKTHETIRRVTVDIDQRIHLNTAVSALMELVNELYAFCDSTAGGPSGREGKATVGTSSARDDRRAREAIEALVLMISPFAPHMCEELWQILGHVDG